MKSVYALFLALALLLGATPSASAQFLWQRALGTAASDETAEYMIPVAGGFVTAGQAGTVSVFDPHGLFLTKVNYAGDTVWTKRLFFAGVQIFYPRGLVVDAAGNLVVSATTFPPAAPPTAPPAVNQGLLVKLTATGDTVWTRPVRSPAQCGLGGLVLGNDGSYVAIGDLGTLPVLYKFSPAGALLWTQVVPYDNTRSGNLQNIVAVPNGYFLISSPNVGNIKSKYITVNEQGVYQFEHIGSIYYPHQLRLDSQGDILATRGDLLKLSVRGDSLWSRSYRQFGQFLGLKRVVELPNGNYLVAGERYNGPERDVGIAVVDHNGTLLRDTLFARGGSDENVAGVALTPAGHYVVALGTNMGPVGFADQVLFAYRNWNRLLPTRAPQPAAAALHLFPTPAHGAVQVQWPATAHPVVLEIADALGRTVTRVAVARGAAGTGLPLDALPPGLYVVQATGGGPGGFRAQRLLVE